MEKLVELRKKIPDASNLLNTRVFNLKVGKVENKIRDVSDLIKKTDYNSKISDIEVNWFTTSYYIIFTK